MARKKVSSIVRTTISIPQGLKQRMDELGDSVNWSAVACHAFEDKVAEAAARKRGASTEDVLERLRASRRRAEDADYQDGEGEGARWVERRAEVAELRRLEQWRDACGRDWDDLFDADSDNVYGPGELFYFAAISPDDFKDRSAARLFWDGILDGRDNTEPTPAFIRGFIEGALARWDDLKELL